MAGIASTRGVEGAGWADIYSNDAFNMERMVNAAIHHMLAATPSAQSRYGASIVSSFGRVILKRTHPVSLDHHMETTCYAVAQKRTATLKYFPLEPLQREIMSALFHNPIGEVRGGDARGVIIGDVQLGSGIFQMRRGTWYNPTEDKEWNGKVYEVLKQKLKHRGLISTVIENTSDVMKALGLREGEFKS